MEKHEAACNGNPDRICAMHAFATREKQPTMTALTNAAEVSLAELLRVAGGCPACMFAAQRQGFPLAEGVIRYDSKAASRALFAGLEEARHCYWHASPDRFRGGFRQWFIENRDELEAQP
jgi:hypothetical protein